MAVEITSGKESRAKLMAGINILANTVKQTLGPKGRYVVLQGGRKSTKDGVTVANAIYLPENTEDAGVQMIKEVARKTVDETGDGTTTATLLTQAILGPGLGALETGSNPMGLKKGIDKAVKVVVDYLKECAVPINGDLEKIRSVATISSNGDEQIGNIITDAIEKVSVDGVIMAKETNTGETYMAVTNGMKLERGWLSPYFITDPKTGKSELTNPYVLVTDKKILGVKEIEPILMAVNKEGGSLLIICDDVEHTTMGVLLTNKANKAVPSCAIKCPEYGKDRIEKLQDIAAMTGAKFVSEDQKHLLKNVKLEDLGRCDSVVITQTTTTILASPQFEASIDARVDIINGQIESNESDYEKDKLKKRKADLKYGVATIYVGGASELEMSEKADRVDDAIGATKAAIKEGVVVGGGTFFMRAIPLLNDLRGETPDEQAGINIIKRALEEPLRCIADNAGKNGAVIAHEVSKLEGNFGYNARTDVFEDLFEAGVLDPAMVTRVVLQNATSVAAMVLTTSSLITEYVPDK
jgi:chaperonin GroEL